MKRKITPKLLLPVLIVLAAFALFVAAGNKEASTPVETDSTSESRVINGLEIEPGAELTFWEAAGSEEKWVEDVIKSFEEEYNIPVKFEGVSLGDVPTKLKTDGPAKLAADVFCVPHDNMGNLIAAGLIYPNDTSEKSDFLNAAVNAVSFQGTMYGYPASIETYALFYNKDLIKNPPKTFAEIVDFARGYNDIKDNKYALMMEVGNFYFMYGFLSGFGGYVYGQNGTDITDIGLNNSGAVEGMKFLQSLKTILPLNSADINYDIKTALFNEGKLAYDLNGPWAIQGYRDAGVNFGVIPLPELPNGKHPASFSGVRAYFVNTYSDYPNAAKLFASYITSKESLLKRYRYTGQLPPRNDLVKDPEIMSDQVSAAFLEQASYAQPMPSVPQMGLVWEPMGSALQVNWNDGGDPKVLLDNVVQSIQDLIKSQE